MGWRERARARDGSERRCMEGAAGTQGLPQESCALRKTCQRLPGCIKVLRLGQHHYELFDHPVVKLAGLCVRARARACVRAYARVRARVCVYVWRVGAVGGGVGV